MPVTLDWIKVEYFMHKRGIKDANSLAELAETHRSNMYRISTGEVVPNNVTLARMCYHLGVQPGDVLSYEYSEDDFSKPHILFGLFPIDQKIWTRFRKLDRKWRQNCARWQMDSESATWVGEQSSYSEEDGEPIELPWLTLLEAALGDEDTGMMDQYKRADSYANIEIIQAISQKFYEYCISQGVSPKASDLVDIEQLKVVYLKDPVVANRRTAFELHFRKKVTESGGNFYEFMDSDNEAEIRAGLEIERDWAVLNTYQGPMDSKGLVDYVEHHAKPIGDMDLSLQEWDKSVAAIVRLAKAKADDQRMARTIAQGMDDKED